QLLCKYRRKWISHYRTVDPAAETQMSGPACWTVARGGRRRANRMQQLSWKGLGGSMTSRRSWALLAAEKFAALSVVSSGLVGATEVATPPWITITREARAGQGLDPLPADDSNFEHILSHGGGARAKLLSQGEFLVMVFESQDGAVRYSDYPG